MIGGVGDNRHTQLLRKKPPCNRRTVIPAFAGKMGVAAALYPFPSRMLSTSGAAFTAWFRSSPGVRLPSGCGRMMYG